VVFVELSVRKERRNQAVLNAAAGFASVHPVQRPNDAVSDFIATICEATNSGD
jgi:hypothetical protein